MRSHYPVPQSPTEQQGPQTGAPIDPQSHRDPIHRDKKSRGQTSTLPHLGVSEPDTNFPTEDQLTQNILFKSIPVSRKLSATIHTPYFTSERPHSASKVTKTHVMSLTPVITQGPQNNRESCSFKVVRISEIRPWSP